MESAQLCCVAFRWEDLPGAVLAHLLQLAPYKRADVKLVCTSWRAAVNASIKTVSLPDTDLDLLHQLTAVQALTVGTLHPHGEPLAPQVDRQHRPRQGAG